jgi:hypothetical protein
VAITDSTGHDQPTNVRMGTVQSIEAKDTKSVARGTALRATATNSAKSRVDGFFSGKSIDDATRQRVVSILTEEHLANLEIRKQSRLNGAGFEETERLLRENTKNAKAQLIEALGREEAEALAKYEAAGTYRPVAQDFAARCVSQGVGISPATTESIAAILTNALLHSKNAEGNPEFTKKRDETAMAEASKILNPQQLELFRQVLAERQRPWETTQPRN